MLSALAGSASVQRRGIQGALFGRSFVDGFRFVALGYAALLALLMPPVDVVADSDLTFHMFQHIGLFVSGMVLGYGLEIVLISKLASLRRLTVKGWRLFTGLMRINARTKGILFVVVLPILVFAYWHFPQNFDLAVQNNYVHQFEHFWYVTAGTLAGVSIQAVSRKWRVVLLFMGFMNLGMMGSMWTVWRPGYFPIYDYAANLQMGTALMLFGGLGVLLTSSWLLKVIDVI